MKVALVIGHTSKQKGALSKYFEMREWDFYIEVSKYFAANENVDIITHNPNISGYTTRIKNTSSRLKDYDLVLELHFNSFFEDTANGCETLYFYRNENARRLAVKFSKIVNECTGIKVRGTGAKSLSNRKDRGFASVYYPKPTVLLIEPFFGSNKSDCEKIKSPYFMANIIKNFLNEL